ncbi:actin patches distal protein 1 [Arthroderma uncinatum]|uniref:actin patches distal protein 1 n=1 Tax=Arthroderma uncinatum TaxID=74035 RepID=UPI00144AB740|nr:actin patches distal protein 1 [Arthroderma uncinatum]KAF3479956.1 actin patches distal protein 1 [Arthroderma uncinatum]
MLSSIFSRVREAWTEQDKRPEVNSSTESSRRFIFPSVDPDVDGEDCDHDCANCTIRYPSKFKVEEDGKLYGKVKPVTNHVLVATGRSDWMPKAENEKGSLMEAFRRDSSQPREERTVVLASNISVEPVHGDGDRSRTSTTVLLLPAFLYVDHVSATDIPELNARFISTVKADDSASREPASNSESNLQSRPCKRDYVVLLCSHKSRDARCGISAPLIKRELERHLRPLGLLRDEDDQRPGGVGIFFVSHVGGHKFAANVLIYRKEDEQMIWLARIRPEHCEGIVKHTIVNGKVVRPDSRLRGGFDRKRGLMSW